MGPVKVAACRLPWIPPFAFLDKGSYHQFSLHLSSQAHHDKLLADGLDKVFFSLKYLAFHWKFQYEGVVLF